MKTAQEILSKIKAESIWGDMGDEYAEDDVIKAINEARIEAIKECAEVAKLKITGERREDMPTGSHFRTTPVYVPIYEVNKQSILSLIDQIK